MGVHYERARLLSSQGRYEQAERELREVLAENPHHGQAHAFLGRCLAQQKRFTEALAECEEAVHLAPQLPYVHYMLALTYDDCGRLPDAEAALREALRLDPRNVDQLNWLSWIQYRRGGHRAALETAEQGLEIDPQHINCLNNRGQYQRVLGGWKNSEATLRTALALGPDNAFTHANLAWTLWTKAHARTANSLVAHVLAVPGWWPEMREARGHFLEALRRDPGSDWARDGAAAVLLARGKAVFRPLMAAALAATGLLLLCLLPPDPAAFGGRIMALFLMASGALAFTFSNGPLYLLMRRGRLGAAVLSPARLRAADCTASCLAVAAAAGVTALFTPPPAAFGVLFLALALVRPLCVACEATPGWPKRLAIAYAVVAAAAGVVMLCFACVGQEPDQIARTLSLAMAGFWASLMASWAVRAWEKQYAKKS